MHRGLSRAAPRASSPSSGPRETADTRAPGRVRVRGPIGPYRYAGGGGQPLFLFLFPPPASVAGPRSPPSLARPLPARRSPGSRPTAEFELEAAALMGICLGVTLIGSVWGDLQSLFAIVQVEAHGRGPRGYIALIILFETEGRVKIKII